MACRPFLPSPGFRRLTSRVSVHEGPPFWSWVGPVTRVPRFLPGFAGHLFSGLPRTPSLLEKGVCQYVLSLCRSQLRRASRARASRAFPTYLAASSSTPGVEMGGKTTPRDGRQLYIIFSTGNNTRFCFAPRAERFLHRCKHDSFYTNKTTAKGVDHPCYKCAQCVRNRLYDPEKCQVCLMWLEKIKENGVEAKQCCDLWVKWNRSLVSIWKHNKVVMYADPKVDMIVWENAEKFALWEPYLPAPKIRQRREKAGDAESTTLPSQPLSSSSQHTPDRQGPAGAQNPELNTDSWVQSMSHVPSFSSALVDNAPSLGSDWSGFADDLDDQLGQFDLLDPSSSVVPPSSLVVVPSSSVVVVPSSGVVPSTLAPPSTLASPSCTLLNPGRKRAHSPDPSPSSRPTVENPASGRSGVGSVPGFSAEQLASLQLIICSCLSSPAAPPAVAPASIAPSPVPPPATVSPLAPLPQPAGVYDDPRPGPSWEYDPPTGDDPSEVPPDDADFDGDYSPELVVLSDTEDGDDINPPVGRSRRDPLHLDAAEVLDRMWHEVPPAIPPIPIPGLQGHTESTTYYCGNKILYRWYDALPQLMLIDGKECLNLPVDQDFVRVFREGGHLAFSIAEPEEEMHAIFRPFVLAAIKTRPKTARLDPPRRDRLRSLASLDLVRKHSSLTPMESSKDKWVESDKALAKKLVATVADAAHSSSLRVLARPIPVLSSSTGFFQYFQGPSLPSLLLLPSTKTFLPCFACTSPATFWPTSLASVPRPTIIGWSSTCSN